MVFTSCYIKLKKKEKATTGLSKIPDYSRHPVVDLLILILIHFSVFTDPKWARSEPKNQIWHSSSYKDWG